VIVADLSGNGNLNLDTGLDVDDDLLDDLGGGVEVDETLVDSVKICQYCNFFLKLRAPTLSLPI
jgi:hypothetical protein